MIDSPLLLGLLHPLLAAAATGHILLTKEDVRAAIGWTGFCWILPLGGVVLYFLLGINRVRRVAAKKREKSGLSRRPGIEEESLGLPLKALAPDAADRFAGHARLAGRITHAALTPGNRLDTLINGDEAYPAMLATIESAERTLALSTYIFRWDATGERFAQALEHAAERGVDVRVIVDAVGSLFNAARLRSRGIAARAFNTPGLKSASILNLRTHRKLLIADGRLGFTGGMNIRDGHQVSGGTPVKIQDLMVRIEGPAVRQLAETFAEDWVFAGGGELEGEGWFPAHLPEYANGAIVRAFADGPDEQIPVTSWLIESMLGTAQRNVRIVTPYFVPDSRLVAALGQAALRGVEVDIVLPRRNNQLLMGWASQAVFAPVLERGCRIWLTPPPFDHTKLMTADGRAALVGSSNWDTRSFRLNFEFNVEIFDAAAAGSLDALAGAKIAAARPLSPDWAENRPLFAKLRDRAAWLLSPYL